MRRCRLLPGVALLATFAVAPAAPARGRPTNVMYDVTHARIGVTVRFRGDGTDTCRRAGLCGYSGAISYSLRAKGGDSGANFFSPGVSNVAGFGFVFLIGSGTTTADVSFTDANGSVTQRCSDSVARRHDGLEIGPGARGRVVVVFRQTPDLSGGFVGGSSAFGDDALNTRCAGPSEQDIVPAGAFPSRSYAASRFRRRHFNLVLHKTLPFRAAGFAGTVRTTVLVVLRRESGRGSQDSSTSFGVVNAPAQTTQTPG